MTKGPKTYSQVHTFSGRTIDESDSKANAWLKENNIVICGSFEHFHICIPSTTNHVTKVTCYTSFSCVVAEDE